MVVVAFKSLVGELKLPFDRSYMPFELAKMEERDTNLNADKAILCLCRQCGLTTCYLREKRGARDVGMKRGLCIGLH